MTSVTNSKRSLPVVKSTNGTGQLIIAIVSILALLLGIPEQEATAFAAEVTAFIFLIRELLNNKQIFLRTDWKTIGNAITWLGVILLYFLPEQVGLADSLERLGIAISNQNIGAILAAAASLAQIIWNILREKNSKGEENAQGPAK